MPTVMVWFLLLVAVALGIVRSILERVLPSRVEE
jgi:hypothetical protein